jgi:hypothetical protein
LHKGKADRTIPDVENILSDVEMPLLQNPLRTILLQGLNVRTKTSGLLHGGTR